MKINGHVLVTVRDINGKIKERRENHNLIVTTGLNEFTKYVAENGHSREFYLGYGTSSTTPTLGNTNLLSPIANVRNVFTDIYAGYSTDISFFSDDDRGWVGTNIRELGMFSSQTDGAGIMYRIFS